MQRRILHTVLCFLVLVQPVAGVAASASIMGASFSAEASMDTHDMSAMEMPGMEMPGCHDAVSIVPECCDQMDGVSCGMDCGTVSPALTQPHSLSGMNGHGVFEGHSVYAPPSRSPNTFLRPPRTS